MTLRDVLSRITVEKHLAESPRGFTDFMVRRQRQAETSKEAENGASGRFSCGPASSSSALPTISLLLATFPILIAASYLYFCTSISRGPTMISLLKELRRESDLHTAVSVKRDAVLSILLYFRQSYFNSTNK